MDANVDAAADKKPDADTQAKAEMEARNRFLLLNLMRIGGVIMVLTGIAISRQAIAIAPQIGWALIALGLIEILVVPQMLARMWRSDSAK